MASIDALVRARPTPNETHSTWVPLQISDLPSAIKIDAGDHLDHKIKDNPRLRKLSTQFEPNAHKLAMEMSETFARSGRIMRVYVEDIYGKPSLFGVGFHWSHDALGFYTSREFMVAKDGKLFEYNTEESSYPKWEPTDAPTFLNFFKQFVEEARFAQGELAGLARDITTRFVINLQEVKK